MTNSSPVRVAVLQRVIPSYRFNLFKLISCANELDVRFFIGQDIKDSKVKSSTDLSSIIFIIHRTLSFYLFNYLFVWHRGLLSSLRSFKPNVILCEGESNFLSYFIAILYSKLFNKCTLIHWSLGSVPGAKKSSFLKRRIKSFFLSFFDIYISYSSYGKKSLINLGVDPDAVHVVVNVSDTNFYYNYFLNFTGSKDDIKKELCLPLMPLALFVGALDDDKNVDVLLDAFSERLNNNFALILVGDGKAKDKLQTKVLSSNIPNIFFVGHMPRESISKYFLACDVFVLPGRGGMVISEAMSFGLPVILHQADGTEFDLIDNYRNGIILSDGDSDSFLNALNYLFSNPDLLNYMGRVAQETVVNGYSQEIMASQISNIIYNSFNSNS